MAESGVDPESVPADPSPSPSPRRGRPAWVRGVACLAMVPLIGFIGQSGRDLWGEWDSLKRDRVDERESAIVGYVDIQPRPNYAGKPANWLHDEGDDSLLWAGWQGGEHRWFRVARGDLGGWPLSDPIGRDSIPAIDRTILEAAGGARWGRIPPEAPVVGFEQGGLAVAYPVKVLNKVEIVNDRIAGRPILVVLDPDAGPVAVYEATVEGRRLTLGHSGYFKAKTPVLYDRATSSLWAEQGGAMVALAGPRKGARLARIATLRPVPWSDWLASHPDGRLVVGADRSGPPPSE